jgi:hypothetical protein
MGHTEFFWIEFMFPCLPSAVRDFYNDSINQTKYEFQSFKEDYTFWVRQSVEENNFGEFNLSVFSQNWVSLPYSIHQEWNEEYKCSDNQKPDCIQIENYSVCKNTIKNCGSIYIQGKTYRMKAVGDALSFETYCIYRT